MGGRNGYIRLGWFCHRLEIKIREDIALSVFVGSTARHRRLGWCERLIISREAAAGVRSLGYSAYETNERQNSVGKDPGEN